tara:strand:+ start:2253 stop:4016 length:1764 start_codon:yes stop_codon:yes gene_type:complete
MKLSDFVIQRIYKAGVKHVFMLPGGGAMHLNDSLGKSKNVDFICNLHEQASSIAAEAYSQYTNNLGVCMVTTGPGSTNAITGVASAWLDSIPMLIISGQVKTSDLSLKKNTRQIGFQEINIVPMVKDITKYAKTINNSNSIKYHIDKAIWLAKQGRPGPSWIDIPLDIQAQEVNIKSLKKFTPPKTKALPSIKRKIDKFYKLLNDSKRPIILVGNGVRLSKSEKELMKLINYLKIPTLLTWKAADLIHEYHPYLIGRPGAVGQRAANISQQNSDLFIMLGARMDMGQTAYMHKYLAPKAKKVMIDIDKFEIKKMNTKIDLPIVSDSKLFINQALSSRKDYSYSSRKKDWLERCIKLKKKFPVILPEYFKYKDGVSIYALVEKLSDFSSNKDLFIPGSSGACSEVTMQAIKIKKGVRIFNSEGLGAMGFGISSAIGGCIASNKRRTITIDGDGGFMMNTQELETVRRLNLPIKFFILDNKGYGSIRATQTAYFNKRFYGSSKSGGLTLPELKKIANAYKIKYFNIESSYHLEKITKDVLEYEGPVICRVKISPNQVTAPRVMSRQTKNGSMETAPMENMWPPIDLEEL